MLAWKGRAGPGDPHAAPPHSNPALSLPFSELGTALPLTSRTTSSLTSEEKALHASQGYSGLLFQELAPQCLHGAPMPALGL